jgi:AraC-like DNA-binding protein/ligand-binding sensor protein
MEQQIAFDNLLRLPVIQHYETAFCKATGVSLKVVGPVESSQRLGVERFKNTFCAMVTRTPGGCNACLEAERHAQRCASQKFGPQQVTCIAGLTHLRVPVLVGGQHVATLLSGEVFLRPRTERDFLITLKKLAGVRNSNWEMKARTAYFETPVVAFGRFQAIAHLLNVFAQYLADYASHHAICFAAKEPKIVFGAKQFVQSHFHETVTLGLVAQHVHVSRFYLCKLFKKTTGMTLTEYVARVRVEKAKALLANTSARVTEVVYASGFGSIPRFNSMFKRYVGMSPTKHRAALRSTLLV